jgi:tetratricopeptide (TPR) repeat protein
LLVALGADVRPQGVNRFNGGAEYAYREKIFLRGGWALDRENNELGRLKGLCAGAGAAFSGWTLDYALTSSGDLGWEHRISLGMRLPSSTPFPATPQASAVLSPTPTPGAVVSPLSGLEVPTAVSSPGSAPTPSGTVVILKFNQEGSPEEAALSAEQLYIRAETERLAGHEDESLRLYLKCVEKDPRHDKAWVRIGQVQYKKALDAVQKALEVNPNNPTLQMWLNRQNGK